MALSYDQTSALMKDLQFQGKIKVAAVKYSDAIGIIDNQSVASRVNLVKWSFRCAQQPDMVANELQPYVVWDPKIQAADIDENGHSLVSDADLQTAVETTVNKQNS